MIVSERSSPSRVRCGAAYHETPREQETPGFLPYLATGSPSVGHPDTSNVCVDYPVCPATMLSIASYHGFRKRSHLIGVSIAVVGLMADNQTARLTSFRQRLQSRGMLKGELTERRGICNDKETESWLGGLDSNQDNQIQNLMYCQLYDLPTL
jgi:hypothetical protein